MAKKTKASAEKQLVLTRVFKAPRDLVFKAWTDPKHVMGWWGPKDFTSPKCSIDFRLGGAFHFCMRSPDGQEYWTKGYYHQIQAPELIVSTMFFSDEAGNFQQPSIHGFKDDFPAEMLDTVTFEKLKGNKTRFTLHRNKPMSLAKRYQEDTGWNQSLDKFEEVLAKL